jgi:hypothetical protein
MVASCVIYLPAGQRISVAQYLLAIDDQFLAEVDL